jgi:excinuclease ABC subunit C
MVKKPQKIPDRPGIYLFKDKRGSILYVGKAASLKDRLAFYFSKREKDARVQKMLGEADRVEWREYDSEIEAFLAEVQEIKESKPRYNIVFRDDKQYSYAVITDDPFPKIITTHQPEVFTQESSSIVFGPFVEGGTLKFALKIFRKIFPFCTCRKPHNNFCLNYHIGNCPGFCCLKNPTITDDQYQGYQENIKSVKELLAGQRQRLLASLKKDMAAEAQEHNFEKALELRDKIQKIKMTFANAKIIKKIAFREDGLDQLTKLLNLPRPPRRIEGYDISNIQGRYAVGSMVVFWDGNPDKNEYRKFKIKTVSVADDLAMLGEIIERRLKHHDWLYPDVIIVDGGKNQLKKLESALRDSLLKIPVIALTKNNKHRGSHIFVSGKRSAIPLSRLTSATRDLILQIDEEAHHFAIGYYRKLHSRQLRRN